MICQKQAELMDYLDFGLSFLEKFKLYLDFQTGILELE